MELESSLLRSHEPISGAYPDHTRASTFVCFRDDSGHVAISVVNTSD